MTMEHKSEKNFWRYWPAGLLLLALMIILNIGISNDVSPLGIRDHQSAGTAARVDAIQAAWAASGRMWLAQLGVIMDLIYIGVYSFGAYHGGRFLTQNAPAVLGKLGWLIAVAALILAVADYTETICQTIQIMQNQGNDTLASIAAAAQPIKSLAFLTTFLGLLAGLIIRRMSKRPA